MKVASLVFGILMAPAVAFASGATGSCGKRVCGAPGQAFGNAFVDLYDYAKAEGVVIDVGFDPSEVLPPHLFDSGMGDCNMGSSPPSGASSNGASHSGATTCNYQLANGDVYRVTVSFTWRYNANSNPPGWDLVDVEAVMKLIKGAYQNQTE